MAKKMINSISRKKRFEYAIFKEIQAMNVDFGSATGSWLTRTLNVCDTNIVGVSLASNQFELPLGNWIIIISTPNYASQYYSHRLYDVDAADIKLDVNGDDVSGQSYSSGNCEAKSESRNIISLSALSTFEIQYQCSVGKSGNGLGLRSYYANAQFSRVECYKI